VLKKKRGIGALNDKNMHYIGTDDNFWNKVYTLEFDVDSEFGAFKKVCADVIDGPIEQTIKKLRCAKE
jgi:hypothetical protein